MRIAIYARISDDAKGEEVGVDRQVTACEALSAKLGGTIVALYSDNDISAYSGKPRPDFERLLKAMAKGQFDILVIWHIDRLFRSMPDLERIIDAAEKTGVRIETVNSGNVDLSTSSGKMIARILGSVARQESEHHAERRRSANKARAVAGQWRREGSRPFGYDGTGTPLNPEAPMIRKAVSDILSGKSLHAVAREWNDSEVTTVRGVRWTNLHVRRVVTNPRIAALVVHQGEIVGEGKWPAIIDSATFHGLVAFLSDPNRKNAVAFERRYLGSGVYICGHRSPEADPDDPASICGRRLYAAHPHGKDKPMTYTCRPVVHLGRGGRELDLHVQTYAFGHLLQNAVGTGLREADKVDIADLRAKRTGLQETKDQLATLLRKGILDLPAVERESQVLTREIAQINSEIAEATQVGPMAMLLADGEDPEILADEQVLTERWLYASLDIRGKIIGSIWDVVIHPARGKRSFDPDLVEFRPR